ncbi:MAG: hypothetical protein O8C62_00890 [Candidatus Methanoperedens sp.]|nr:hypothetical protein [Candidatus Methanoperedens sp.]
METREPIDILFGFKDISEIKRKKYCKLPFSVVWKYWYKERQGNDELLSDRYLLLWLKEHSKDSYLYMQGLLEQWYDKRITDSDEFTKALERRLTIDGLLSVNEDTYSPTPINKDREETGCRHCYIPGRVPRCGKLNPLLNKG